MSYKIQMSRGEEINLTDEEYEAFKVSVKNGNIFSRKRDGSMINPAFFISAERIPELPKNDPDAVDKWMENKRNQDNKQSNGNENATP